MKFLASISLFAALLAVPAQAAETEPPVHLFDYDAQVSLDVELTPFGEEDGITIYNVSYASPAGGRVTGRLYVPAGPGPFAGIVYAHGTGSGAITQGPRAVYLARHGAVVLTPDAPYIRRGGEFPTFTDLDRVEQIQHIQELRRGFDLLLARPEVDPARLAFIGRSHGGAMGVLLAGVEHRIKTCILIVADGGLVEHFTSGGGATELFESQPADVREAWLAAMRQIEPSRFFHRATTSVLFQNGRKDDAVVPSLAESLHRLAHGDYKIRWYDAGHRLNVQSFIDQLDWLHERLGMSPAGPEDAAGPKFPAPAKR